MNNQKLAVIVLVISFFTCVLLLMYSHTKSTTHGKGSQFAIDKTRRRSGIGESSSASHSKQSQNTFSENGAAAPLGHSQLPGSNQATSFSPCHGARTPLNESTVAAPYLPSDTAAELAEKAAAISEHRKNVLEASETWLRTKISDKNLDEKTREVYRLRLLPNMKQGLELFDKGDFAGAVNEFNKALEDPDASPVSKYLIHDYMLQAAAKMKDKNLYIKLLKSQGIIQRDNELKALGLQKSDQALEYAKDMEEHIKAAQDSAAFDKLVDHTMQAVHATSAEREKIENSVKKRIKEFEAFFDESERKS